MLFARDPVTLDRIASLNGSDLEGPSQELQFLLGSLMMGEVLTLLYNSKRWKVNVMC